MNVSEVKAMRPRANLIKDYKKVPLDETIITSKCDGEFEVIRFENGVATMYNQGGKQRTDLDCLKELTTKLSEHNIESATLLAECYAVDGEKMLRLPDFLSIIKGSSTAMMNSHLRLAVFDLVKLNGNAVSDSYGWRLDELADWLGGLSEDSKAYVVPYISVTSIEQIQNFWSKFVTHLGYEGLFTRSNGDLFKVKPCLECDCLVVGINKSSRANGSQSFDKGLARSLKIALMQEDGNYVVLGDVGAGINNKIAKALYKHLILGDPEHDIPNLVIGEDERTVWVHPRIIIQIEYEALYKKEQTILQATDQAFQPTTLKQSFVSLRHPRFIRFRRDKQPTYQDVPIGQVNGF